MLSGHDYALSHSHPLCFCLLSLISWGPWHLPFPPWVSSTCQFCSAGLWPFLQLLKKPSHPDLNERVVVTTLSPDCARRWLISSSSPPPHRALHRPISLRGGGTFLQPGLTHIHTHAFLTNPGDQGSPDYFWCQLMGWVVCAACPILLSVTCSCSHPSRRRVAFYL